MQSWAGIMEILVCQIARIPVSVSLAESDGVAEPKQSVPVQPQNLSQVITVIPTAFVSPLQIFAQVLLP